MASSQQSSKPRVVKDYEKLDDAVVEQIKLEYPGGFAHNLVKFTNAAGDEVSALPFETEDRYYLVRMTVKQARQIIAEDEDYDADGNLKPRVQAAYNDRYGDDDDDDDDDLGADDGEFDIDAELGDASFDDDEEDELTTGTKQDGTVGLDGVDVVDPGSV